MLAGDDSDDADDEEEEGAAEPGTSTPKLQPTARQRKSLRWQTLAALRLMKNAYIDLQNGITMLQSVVEDTPISDLAQLLKHVAIYAPQQPPVVVKADPGAESSAVDEGDNPDDEPEEELPRPLFLAKQRKYTCTKCGIIKSSRNAVISHIIQLHDGKSLTCGFCGWTTTNPDSLNRHSRMKHQDA